MSLFSMDESSVWGKGSSLFNISRCVHELMNECVCVKGICRVL